MRFNGDDYTPSLDAERLRKQHLRVRNLMADGKWRTLQEIADQTGDPTPSISAHLRHLRKPRFGKYIVEKRRTGASDRVGLYEYRVIGREHADYSRLRRERSAYAR